MRKLKIINYFCLSLVMVIGLLTVVASGGGGDDDSDTSDDTTIETFNDNGGAICTEDSKPVIRMFSTSTCPHCLWVGDTFDDVVQKYVDEGSIVAHHWEIWNLSASTGDDLLTDQVEGSIPASEIAIYNTYSGGYVPTFVFGCRYYRVGNGYETENDLKAEAAEFMAVIEELLDSVP